MIIFKDIFTEAELMSDSYRIETLHDAVLKIKTKRVTESGGIDENLLGSNPSAEGEDADGTEEAGITNYDVVFNHQLVETHFGKKDYMTYIKDYMKSVKKRLETENPERVPIFAKGAETFIKEVLKSFKEYQFFMGSNMDPDGMVALCRYEDDGHPYFYLFKDGLIEEKC
jgi:hypothetical protein